MVMLMVLLEIDNFVRLKLNLLKDFPAASQENLRIVDRWKLTGSVENLKCGDRLVLICGNLQILLLFESCFLYVGAVCVEGTDSVPYLCTELAELSQ